MASERHSELYAVFLSLNEWWLSNKMHAMLSAQIIPQHSDIHIFV